jgi:translation initiation factor IF-3
VPEVRLIDDHGNQVGVLKTPDALKFAQERDLDLVEVAPEARPPVCRVLDYSKYKYEQAQKVKQAKKHQQQITIREIKFRPKIAQHDYDTKKHHVERFLRHKDKVKVTIMFRGREVTHPERGVAMMLGPSKAVLAGRADGEHETDGVAPEAADETPAPQEAPPPSPEPAGASTEAEQGDSASNGQAAPDAQAATNA